MDEPFYYLSVEDVVPRDAAHVIIGGSVRVVPALAFEGYLNLARVEFQEGVEVIGRSAFAECYDLESIDWASSIRRIDDWAFHDCWLSELVLPEGLEEIGRLAFYECKNLERVDCPSSLRRIGDYAFAFDGCGRLSKVVLREGLEKIGCGAFKECDLRRITIPSSVVEIGSRAFSWCRRLSEVILMEGLQRIGAWAFDRCDLERIALPSSVVEMGRGAFYECERLSEVTLAGGMVMVARGAFARCPRLGQIAFPSMAIVANYWVDGRAAAVTGGIPRDPRDESPRFKWDSADESRQLILASPHLALMRPEELTNLTDAIDRVADTMRGGGPLDLADGDVSTRIRDCFVDHLSTWYRCYKREAAAILELGLWKIELGRAAGAAREVSRVNSGADPIVGLVLSSLAGPHRRAGQAENAASIQP